MGEFTIAEMSEHIGRELGVSDWVTIDQSRNRHFRGLHRRSSVDPRRRRAGQARKPVSRPDCSRLSDAVDGRSVVDADRNPSQGFRGRPHYGIDKVRFLAPVPAGARVRLRVVLAGFEPRDGGQAIMKTQNTLEVEGSQKPALIAETLALLIPAKGAAKQ